MRQDHASRRLGALLAALLWHGVAVAGDAAAAERGRKLFTGELPMTALIIGHAYCVAIARNPLYELSCRQGRHARSVAERSDPILRAGTDDAPAGAAGGKARRTPFAL